MEPEIKAFFKKVSLTILSVILWLSIHLFIGINLSWAFFNDTIEIGNLIYYFFLLITFTILVKIIFRIWKNEFDK